MHWSHNTDESHMIISSSTSSSSSSSSKKARKQESKIAKKNKKARKQESKKATTLVWFRIHEAQTTSRLLQEACAVCGRGLSMSTPQGKLVVARVS